MRGKGFPPDDRLAKLVREASDHNGPWPSVSVWHGSADKTVCPSNAERLIAQWRGVYDLGGAPDEREIVDGCERRTWRDRSGRSVIEAFQITDMGHGTRFIRADRRGVERPLHTCWRRGDLPPVISLALGVWWQRKFHRRSRSQSGVWSKLSIWPQDDLTVRHCTRFERRANEDPFEGEPERDH